MRSNLEQIRAVAHQAGDLTKQLLAYAGKAPASVVPVDVGALVREMASVLRVSVGHSSELALDISPEGLVVVADPAQIRQVVLNLLTNAAEATGPRGGTIRLRAGRTSIPGPGWPSLVVDATAGQGAFVYVDVCDDGCGLAPETLARIFDPFFTTKFTGRGLGLAVVQGIVRAYRGAIAVESAPGKGSRFAVFLPASEDPLVVPSATPPEAGERLAARVLVADDEPRLRATMREALTAVGAEVIAVSDGLAAVEEFEAGTFDVLVLDETMPKMGGRDALAAIRERDPNVPSVLVSGWSAGTRVEGEGTIYLGKPFDPEELVRVVARLAKARRALRDGS